MQELVGAEQQRGAYQGLQGLERALQHLPEHRFQPRQPAQHPVGQLLGERAVPGVRESRHRARQGEAQALVLCEYPLEGGQGGGTGGGTPTPGISSPCPPGCTHGVSSALHPGRPSTAPTGEGWAFR